MARTDGKDRSTTGAAAGTFDSPRVRSALRVAYAAGVDEYGELDVSLDAFCDHALAVTIRRLERYALDATPERLRESLDAAVGTDLYLAAACNAGDEQAWRVLHDRFEACLTARVVRQGARGAKPRQLVHDLLGELSMPAPQGRARTLIGTFDASGSLLGWLTSILARRHGRTGRPAREHPLREGTDEAATTQPRRSTTAARDPFESVAGRDEADVWREAFRRGWETLSPRERLVLVLKYRDGLRQREVASAIGITESAISRHVSRAIARLKLALRGTPIEGEPGSDLWEALGQVVSENLSRSRAANALYLEGSVDPPAESP